MIAVLIFLIIIKISVSKESQGYQIDDNFKENYTNDWRKGIRDGIWQPVAGTRYKFYVFSAYIERYDEPAVRIIAATKTVNFDDVICRLTLPDNRMLTLKATVEPISENWSLEYSAAFVLCLLDGSQIDPTETVGGAVAVITKISANQSVSNQLTVKDTTPKTATQDILHVCVKPLHNSYERELWLVEWIELNRLLGASHFYIYNVSVSRRVNCILKHYMRQGLITLLSWDLPILSKTEIRTEGMFAAFNDCLYRSMSEANWLMPIDLDEVVFPNRRQTIPNLLSNLSTTTFNRTSRVPAAFNFRNTFFYTQWENDRTMLKYPLLTSLKTRRSKYIFPHMIRSKYAVRPQKAIMLGNHFIWKLKKGETSIPVPYQVALLHHYRESCAEKDCLKLPSLIDRTAHMWTNNLWKNVLKEEEQIIKI